MNSRPGFSVIWRNPGHWDVFADGPRAFRIRGEAPEVVVFDERDGHLKDPARDFRSVAIAMAWIADTLMEPFNLSQDAGEGGEG